MTDKQRTRLETLIEIAENKCYPPAFSETDAAALREVLAALDAARTALAAAESRLAAVTEALAFYAADETWEECGFYRTPDAVLRDGGDRARKALSAAAMTEGDGT